ncbi:hypothetical protein PISL3812_03771 [Talaromyces islandicus]|uniref:RNA polymerase II subunit B1 CTD phosphatase RPAP2 homolog n=1 Tax=Talaromyces islandicus TaxID=28573 RepID=A0A0U1LW15_TALIS|nr:hypothetical protein PISL3812_03771 [Talaromyces islandicus]
MQQSKNAQPQPTQYKHRDGRAPNPQHLAIALHHANQIQAQKDAEAFILDRILELIELPSSPSADAANPSPADAAALKAALVPFQPTDFDNLVLERNIEGRCGYTLCPREHRKEDTNAKFRIMWGPKGSDHGRGREMRIVSREKLEMWCSEACAERAMYLRLQLAEDPVWERRAGDGATKQVTLLEEARALRKTKKAVKSEGEGQQRLNVAGSVAPGDSLEALTQANSAPSDAEGQKQLAVERGDSNSAFQQTGRVDIQILEKEPDITSAKVAAPSLGPGDQTGGSIEGYVPHTADNVKNRAGQVRDEGNGDDVLDSL